MYRFCLLFLLFFTFTFSSEIDDISQLEKGLAKDFVIFQYLKSHSLSSEDAKKLSSQIFRKTYRLDRLFNDFIKDEKQNFKFHCLDLDIKELIKTDAKCIFIGLTPQKAQKLSLKNQKIVYKKLKKLYQNETSWLKSMIAKDSFKSLSKGDGEDFIKVFNSVEDKYKHKILDKKLPPYFLKKLANAQKFESFVLNVILDGTYKKLPRSLLLINPNEVNLTYNSSFYLGILALKLNRPKNASTFFEKAQTLSEDVDLQDKALFWQYKATNDEKYLQKLAKSAKFNFYALYAKELLNIDDYEITSPSPTKEDLEYYSITDPYSWDYTKRHIEKLDKPKLAKFAERFFTKATLPYYVYLMQRVNGFSKIYFIAPYQKYIENSSPKRKTLIYAIARQESRCIPVDVSKSYALGMMQFMPFLARAVAKEEDIKNFKYFDMFHPKIALKFANIHLDYLENYLFNPLFIAYAYNGGIGFTRRMLQKNTLFKKGKYEPFLSMELVPYGESREYGKKVLANYVIYSKIFGEKTTLKYLLKNLTEPSLSYRFQ